MTRFSLLILLLVAQVATAQLKMENTIKKYSAQIDNMEEDNDCSVRMVAEAFNMSYEYAHAVVKSWGRVDGEGMKLLPLIKGVHNDFKDYFVSQKQLPKFISPSDFVDEFVEDGYTYIVFGKAHVFVIEQRGTKNIWTVKGNHNDKNTPIQSFIKIQING